MKEFKEKGYFIMADGTKSSDHAPKKKKKAKSDVKPTGKKSESGIKGKKPAAAKADAPKGGAKKGAAAAGKSKKSEDDLDIESEESHRSEELEASD